MTELLLVWRGEGDVCNRESKRDDEKRRRRERRTSNEGVIGSLRPHQEGERREILGCCTRVCMSKALSTQVPFSDPD